MRFFSPARLRLPEPDDVPEYGRAGLELASNAVVSVVSVASASALATAAAMRQRFSAATRDVAAAPATFTMTLMRSRSRGMSESGQRREAASCAAERRIGRRKLPPEARRSGTSPSGGVVDVAAVGLYGLGSGTAGVSKLSICGALRR